LSIQPNYASLANSENASLLLAVRHLNLDVNNSSHPGKLFGI